jgi:hypothetical protein
MRSQWSITRTHGHAAIITHDKSDKFLRYYLPDRDKFSDQKQRDQDRANRLFLALDESGDGVLEVSPAWLFHSTD